VGWATKAGPFGLGLPVTVVASRFLLYLKKKKLLLDTTKENFGYRMIKKNFGYRTSGYETRELRGKAVEAKTYRFSSHCPALIHPAIPLKMLRLLYHHANGNQLLTV